MFNGAHMVIYSTDAESDRRFLHDTLKMANVDAGDGWLIFSLPPAEVAFHPGDGGQAHQLYLMCDDIDECRRKLSEADVATDDVSDEGWGLLSAFRLPGGGKVGFY